MLSFIINKIESLELDKNCKDNYIIEIYETAVTKRKFEHGRSVLTLWCIVRGLAFFKL